MKNPFPAPPLHAHPFTPLPLHFFSHSLTTRRAKALTPGEQSLLLALCLNVKNTNPRDGLTNEEMSPFVDAVLEAPKDWAVQTTALLTQVMNPQWRVHTHTHTHTHSHSHTHTLAAPVACASPPPATTTADAVGKSQVTKAAAVHGAAHPHCRPLYVRAMQQSWGCRGCDVLFNAGVRGHCGPFGCFVTVVALASRLL